MNKADWQRRSALFDEAVDLPADARDAWLQNLATREPEHAAALARMLAEYARNTDNIGGGDKSTTLSLMGVVPRDFEARLEAATGDDLQLKVGDEIPPWRLTKKIGEGGMGAVWLAARHDGNFEGHAAIKFLRTGLGKTDVVERFLRERRLLARLTHPNIARLLDAGNFQGEPYLVMQYIDGVPITDWAAAHAPHVADRVALILKVCRAAEHAHGQLIVHRDLKPSNVLVDRSGEPSLLDFGIAKLIDDEDDDFGTALTRMTGRGFTLGYCAPEQITGEATGVAADVFSIGVLLFELLTGALPFKAEPGRQGRAALEHAIVHDDPLTVSRALDAPDEKAKASRPRDAARARGDLDAIVAKTLRKNPQDRYATVSALAGDLDAWLSGKPISIRAEDRSYRSRLWLKRNWLVALLGGLSTIAVIAGLSISLWQRNEAVTAAKLAREEAARATKVADYLGEMIQSASPDNHGGKWPTVLALLEQSEKDLDKQFADDPKTHAVLLKRLAETNDALIRNPTALAQLVKLHELLVKTQSADSDAAMDALKHQAQLLRRLRRHDESRAIDEALLPKFIKRYGPASEEVGNLLLGMATPYTELGMVDEARKVMVDGAAILTKLYPNDLKRRIDKVNSTAVFLTRKAMWREAMNTLATIESDFPALAKLGGAGLRDSIIMRRNLEAIRIRVGSYDGVEQRLRQIIRDTDALLGRDNPQSGLAMRSLSNLYCEMGRFEECMTALNETLASRRKQKGVEDEIVDDEITLVALELRMGRVQSATAPSLRVRIDALFADIPKVIAKADANRALLYRQFADAATDAGVFALAEQALQRARADMASINNVNPERMAQTERAAGLMAYVRGDARRAVQLLEPRFALYEKSAEGDSPRRASLWLQRAIYEIEFDPAAARNSLAKSRDIFGRLGGPTWQWKALIDYVDARIQGSADAIRAAEDAVDRVWTRPRPKPWRAPSMGSV